MSGYCEKCGVPTRPLPERLQKYGEDHPVVKKFRDMQAGYEPVAAFREGLAAGVAQGRERMLAVVEWATGRGCGLSSETMLRASFGLPVSGHIPWDVSDFGRCYGMLRALPWVRESFPAIAKLSPAWADYIENWAALEAAYESEQGQRNCHKTWAIIQGIVARHDARRTP